MFKRFRNLSTQLRWNSNSNRKSEHRQHSILKRPHGTRWMNAFNVQARVDKKKKARDRKCEMFCFIDEYINKIAYKRARHTSWRWTAAILILQRSKECIKINDYHTHMMPISMNTGCSRFRMYMYNIHTHLHSQVNEV